LTINQFTKLIALQKGSRYNFNFFFAERHVSYSVFQIETSVALENCPYIDACGVCNGMEKRGREERRGRKKRKIT
jgi:hypothetical protein